MARLVVKLQWLTDRWGLLLPNYQMVSGSVRGYAPTLGHADGILPTTDPTAPGVAAVICQVDIPDDEARPGGSLIDFAAIRQKYSNHPRFSKLAAADQPQA